MYSYSSNFSTYGEDCRHDGSCSDGTYMIDDCGYCRWIYSSEWNNCLCCDGIVNSGKIWNPCGKCILNTTSNFYTLGKDCNGTCDGSKEYDDCGQCLYRTDYKWNSCSNDNIDSAATTSKATIIGKDDKSSSSSKTEKIQIYAIIGGIAALLIILVIAVCFVLKLNKKQKEQSKQVNKILKEYAQIDEIENQSDMGDVGAGSHVKCGEKDYVEDLIDQQPEGVVHKSGQNM